MTQENSLPETGSENKKAIGRNEPCPCGSGKKYKRCHGVDAAPKVTPPAQATPETGALPPGFDPNQMDPQMMSQMAQALQRLPRGQMQRLQSIMQKAMAGKDVSREAEEFERSLPPDFKQMITSMNIPGMLGGMPGAEEAALAAEAVEAPKTVDEARAVIEKAVQEGKITKEQAEAILAGSAQDVAPEEPVASESLAAPVESPAQQQEAGKFGKFWRNLTGKSEK